MVEQSAKAIEQQTNVIDPGHYFIRTVGVIPWLDLIEKAQITAWILPSSDMFLQTTEERMYQSTIIFLVIHY